jgi:hypothetical protein
LATADKFASLPISFKKFQEGGSVCSPFAAIEELKAQSKK